MDKESKKRAREGEDKKELSNIKSSKKQDLNNNNNNSEQHISLEENNFNNHMSLEVFDFPWLKEGNISKWEDWKFEDTFSSSLNTTTGVEFYGQSLCDQSPVSFPDDDRFDQTTSGQQSDDGLEGVDCIWTSLLNQPIEPLTNGF